MMAICLLLLLLLVLTRNDCIQTRYASARKDGVEETTRNWIGSSIDQWGECKCLIGVSAPEAYSSTLYSLQYFRILRRGRQCINHVQKVLSRFNPGALYQKEPSDFRKPRICPNDQRKQPSLCCNQDTVALNCLSFVRNSWVIDCAGFFFFF